MLNDFREAFANLSSSPSLTFAVVRGTDVEVVGPMNPRGVHYGVTYGSDPETDETLLHKAFPTMHTDWNKYRPDLPPWREAVEVVVSEYDEHGNVVEYVFANVDHYATSMTADLKTVTLVADGVFEGVEESGMIERDEHGIQPDGEWP